MKKLPANFITRFSALFLVFILASPHPALAFRFEQMGQREKGTKSGLEELTHSMQSPELSPGAPAPLSAGLEEVNGPAWQVANDITTKHNLSVLGQITLFNYLTGSYNDSDAVRALRQVNEARVLDDKTARDILREAWLELRRRETPIQRFQPVDVNSLIRGIVGLLEELQGRNSRLMEEVALIFDNAGGRFFQLTLPMHEAIPAEWPDRIVNALQAVGISSEIAPEWVVQSAQETRSSTDRKRIIHIALAPHVSAGLEEWRNNLNRARKEGPTEANVQIVQKSLRGNGPREQAFAATTIGVWLGNKEWADILTHNTRAPEIVDIVAEGFLSRESTSGVQESFHRLLMLMVFEKQPLFLNLLNAKRQQFTQAQGIADNSVRMAHDLTDLLKAIDRNNARHAGLEEWVTVDAAKDEIKQIFLEELARQGVGVRQNDQILRGQMPDLFVKVKVFNQGEENPFYDQTLRMNEPEKIDNIFAYQVRQELIPKQLDLDRVQFELKLQSLDKGSPLQAILITVRPTPSFEEITLEMKARMAKLTGLTNDGIAELIRRHQNSEKPPTAGLEEVKPTEKTPELTLGPWKTEDIPQFLAAALQKNLTSRYPKAALVVLILIGPRGDMSSLGLPVAEPAKWSDQINQSLQELHLQTGENWTLSSQRIIPPTSTRLNTIVIPLNFRNAAGLEEWVTVDAATARIAQIFQQELGAMENLQARRDGPDLLSVTVRVFIQGKEEPIYTQTHRMSESEEKIGDIFTYLVRKEVMPWPDVQFKLELKYFGDDRRIDSPPQAIKITVRPTPAVSPTPSVSLSGLEKIDIRYIFRFLNEPGVSVRAQKTIEKLGIGNFGELLDQQAELLLKERNFGPNSLYTLENGINQFIKPYGLVLRPADSAPARRVTFRDRLVALPTADPSISSEITRVSIGNRLREAAARVQAEFEKIGKIKPLPTDIVVGIGPTQATQYADTLQVIAHFLPDSVRSRLFVLTSPHDSALYLYLQSLGLAADNVPVDLIDQLRGRFGNIHLRADYHATQIEQQVFKDAIALHAAQIQVIPREMRAELESFLQELLATLARIPFETVPSYFNVQQLAKDIALLSKA